MKSGGLKYHGQVWIMCAIPSSMPGVLPPPALTTYNSLGVKIQAPKPVEHQNELSASGGGVVPHTGHKVFFYGAYLKYHYRNVRTPALYTIPTT